MAWSGVITDAGQALIDSWMSGSHTLTIDSASIGSGTVATADMHSSTALASEKDEAAIVRSETVTGGVKIRLQFGPTELTNAYSGKEIGIWARLDGGTKTLLSLHQDDGNGVSIPKKSSFPDFAFAIACVLNTSNTSNLTVTVDTTACATIGDLEDAIAEVDFKAKAHVYTDLTHDGSTIASVKAAIGTCLISFYNDLKTHYSSVSNVVDETFTVRVKTSLCDCDCLVTVDTTAWFSFIAQTASFGTVSGRCSIDASTTPATYSITDANFSTLSRDEDIITLEFSHNVTYRDYGSYFTDEITQYIDNADNYMIISAVQYITVDGQAGLTPLVEKWIYGYDYWDNSGSNSSLNIETFPNGKNGLYIYNDNNKRYIYYHLFNASGRTRHVKFRVMLKRVRNLITVS